MPKKPTAMDRVRHRSASARSRNCQVCALPAEAKALILEAIEARKNGEPITCAALNDVLCEEFGYAAKSIGTLRNHIQRCVGDDPWRR